MYSLIPTSKDDETNLIGAQTIGSSDLVTSNVLYPMSIYLDFSGVFFIHVVCRNNQELTSILLVCKAGLTSSHRITYLIRPTF